MIPIVRSVGTQKKTIHSAPATNTPPRTVSAAAQRRIFVLPCRSRFRYVDMTIDAPRGAFGFVGPTVTS
jgi:hypothetical protein